MDAASEALSRNGLTAPVKALLVLESVGLALLAFWLGKEYQNNVYLREYVHNTGWTYLPVLAFVATFSVALGVSEAYARLRGSKGVEPLSLEAPQALKPLLAGGFGVDSPPLQQGSSSDSTEGSGDGPAGTGAGVSFAQVFVDSRPPVVLRHVEPSEAIDVYSPPPFPVIRRLEPARSPVEEEPSRPTPRPLNRVGMPPGYELLPPPVIRQIRRNVPADDGNEEDLPVESAGQDESSPQEETGSRREAVRTVRQRPVRKKPGVTSDLTNDLA
jgi:hypothetical protein